MKITEPFVYETRFLSSQLKSYPMSNIHINVNDYYWSEIHNTEKMVVKKTTLNCWARFTIIVTFHGKANEDT